MEVPGSIHQNAAKIDSDKSKHEINITNPYLTLKKWSETNEINWNQRDIFTIIILDIWVFPKIMEKPAQIIHLFIGFGFPWNKPSIFGG